MTIHVYLLNIVLGIRPIIKDPGFQNFTGGKVTLYSKERKADYKRKYHSIAGSGTYPLAANCCQICKASPGTQSLAGGKYIDPVFCLVGLDDLEHSNLLLDHTGAGSSGGWLL